MGRLRNKRSVAAFLMGHIDHYGVPDRKEGSGTGHYSNLEINVSGNGSNNPFLNVRDE